jgi:hypothetical protein
MANPEHLAKLKEGVEAWNQWWEDKLDVSPDLSEADLRGTNLFDADLFGAKLIRADLKAANLREANLREADFTHAKLMGTDLCDADLSKADLSGANLKGTNLRDADLSMANLSGANLKGAVLFGARLIRTNFTGANLTGCNVFGIAVWDIRLDGAIQSNLIITRSDQPVIQVDNLEVTQFLYLLLKNERIRHVIETITSKVVLILGRFTPERKAVLDAIRDELRKRDYLPVLFDFEKPGSKDLTWTVATLANMARFIIADLTDPSSVPHELASIIPTTPVALQTVIQRGQNEYAMFADLRKRYRWVLNPYRYDTQETLLGNLDVKVIAPAEAKAKALMPKSKRIGLSVPKV